MFLLAILGRFSSKIAWGLAASHVIGTLSTVVVKPWMGTDQPSLEGALICYAGKS